MEERAPQVITGVFKLTYNRGHYTRLHQVEQLIRYHSCRRFIINSSRNKANRQTITPHKILTRLRLAV